MKTIGVIGGLSWYSSIDYYLYINQAVNIKLGAQGVIFGCTEIPLLIQQQYCDIPVLYNIDPCQAAVEVLISDTNLY